VLRFFILFVVIQAALFGLELTPWAQTHFVVPWTNTLAAISTWLTTVFDPNVAAAGKIMRSTTNGFAVSIEAGCNGVEATIVLVAAILAFPAPWTHKLIGLVTGIVAVQGLNVVRVISLFYLGQWDTQWCNGVEATIVLVAAILAFPAPWTHKLIGLVTGIVAVQGLNVVRVISLFYLGQWDTQWFEWAHLYVWQALIMLDVLIVWLIWVRTLPRHGGGAAPPAGPAVATA